MKKVSKKAEEIVGDLEDRAKEYKRLVSNMAHKYVRGRVEYEDLLQEAYVGLIMAERDFDPERSEDFRTYAITRMRGRMYEYGIRNDTLISIPTHVAKAVSYIRQMEKLLDKEPSLQDENQIKFLLIRYHTSEHEGLLADSVLNKLNELKKRIENIARNSKITYDVLAGLAIEAISMVVSEDALFKHQAEDGANAIDQELKDRLETCLGPKQFLVVMLRLSGHSYREIAEQLSKAGYRNNKGKPISRQAVKAILDNARKTIKQLDLLSPSDLDVE